MNYLVIPFQTVFLLLDYQIFLNHTLFNCMNVSGSIHYWEFLVEIVWTGFRCKIILWTVNVANSAGIPSKRQKNIDWVFLDSARFGRIYPESQYRLPTLQVNRLLSRIGVRNKKPESLYRKIWKVDHKNIFL